VERPANDGLHRYYEPVRRHGPYRYSVPCGFSPLGRLPLAAPSQQGR
jgi:hypothetical protein